MPYFLIAPDGDAHKNLARDEYLLDTLRAGEIALYLYVNTSAVIIGRNQNPYIECNIDKLNADGVQLVRRITGGGAVYHDTGNLNYSFIAHKDIYDEKRQAGVIAKALESFNLKCEVSGRNDLTIDGHKFSGNAFAGRGDMRQHHGTLLISSKLGIFDSYLTAPKQKLEAKGVKSVRARICNLSEYNPAVTVESMARALKNAFQAEYGAAEFFEPGDFSSYIEKQRSFEWCFGETPRFDYMLENKFSWGMAHVCFEVSNGTAAKVRVYSDCLDTSLPEQLESCLTGLRFDKALMCARLRTKSPQAAELADFMESDASF